MSAPLLSVEDLRAGYGPVEVLRGVSLRIAPGEVVTLLGRNGMGKTTTVRSIFGLLRPTTGSIRVDGREMTGKPPHVIGRAGLGLVPEGRQIFPTLTVEENLRATARQGGRWDLAGILAFFPRLAERRQSPGVRLSGGEQQMLAIARALMTNPRLLVLDEATEGLAPMIRAEIWEKLAELKREGEAILVIDKNISALKRLADAHVILEKGVSVWLGRAADLDADPEVIDRHLHL
ncbi:MAG: ABC transporter ATP-binding protein [Pseudomonadota bacterium]